MEPRVTRQINDKSVYYTIRWTDFLQVEKHHVNTCVPSEAGLFELYYLDHTNTLHLLDRRGVYYGGLRHVLREIADPDGRKAVVFFGSSEPHDRLYVRYSLTRSQSDMDDILYFFSVGQVAGPESYEHSGRFSHIYVKEITPRSLYTIP